ncbi:PREDICTED: taste receptor type 2 member 1-like [Gekko japonicus]|uniref:Taste receptor type 2 n=1 Tax=Gekko japonicus TaxID=146911 RepID=A0ABM1LFM4_GEKJA|nr:PREDICTED: taste receptor type 2 member 1-like [Gekko japonicus]
MYNFLRRITFTLLVIETLVGMAANGFIVLINCIDWFRTRKLSPNDLILSCLGLSRLAWLVVMTLDRTKVFFSLGNHIWDTHVMPPIVWIFTNSANIWFATWLSVFYLAKIAIFSHPIFLQVKQRISALVPWLLLGSVIFSAMTAVILMTSLNNGFAMCNPSNDSEIKEPDSWKYLDILGMAPNLIPFLIFLSSTILLISSLWKHMRRVQSNGTGTGDLNTQAHLSAIKALASFAVLYLSSFLAITSQAVLILNNMDHSLPVRLLDLVVAAYPSAHTIILILINPKLKQAWVRMLHPLKCCLREVPT